MAFKLWFHLPCNTWCNRKTSATNHIVLSLLWPSIKIELEHKQNNILKQFQNEAGQQLKTLLWLFCVISGFKLIPDLGTLKNTTDKRNNQIWQGSRETAHIKTCCGLFFVALVVSVVLLPLLCNSRIQKKNELPSRVLEVVQSTCFKFAQFY